MSRNLLFRSAKRIATSSTPIVSTLRFSTSTNRTFHSTSSKMGVKHIHNKQEWEALIAEGKPVVVDFFAEWCGPCKAISPLFEKFSNDTTYDALNFAKIDVDEATDVSRELGITAMPTFILLKDGAKAGEVLGANPPGLIQLLQKGL